MALQQEGERETATVPSPSQNKSQVYMSKEELVEKVTIEKKAKEKEKTKREELEAEMIALEEEDHSDLKAIMSNVNKENVPDDMKLLWEQQESILKASSVKGYRWHPR